MGDKPVPLSEYFFSSFENLIFTTKVTRRRQQNSTESKGILKQSESEVATNIQVATGSIHVSSAILQDQVTSFIIYFTNLF